MGISIGKKGWEDVLINEFKELIKQGFDVEFNIGEVFHSVTSEDIDTSEVVYLSNENNEIHEFKNVDELLAFRVDGKTIEEIIKEKKEEEIFY